MAVDPRGRDEGDPHVDQLERAEEGLGLAVG
jgi:hypothetical protein